MIASRRFLTLSAILACAAVPAAAGAQDAPVFKYPYSDSAQAGLGLAAASSTEASEGAAPVLAPTVQFGYDGIRNLGERIDEIEAVARLGLLQDRLTLEPRAGAAFHVDSSMLVAGADRGCGAGAGIAGELDAAMHSGGDSEGFDGSLEASFGPLLGFACQQEIWLFKLTGEFVGGFRVEGREGGAHEDAEAGPRARLVIAAQGERTGGLVTGYFKSAFRVSGERELSAGGAAEVTVLIDDSFLRSYGLGADARWTRVSPADSAERSEAHEGWYAGVTLKGAFRGL